MLFPPGAINHRIPPGMPVEHAALVEPLACALHAVERGDIHLDDVVVVAGMGPIGLCMLQVARLMGPNMVIALDARSRRLEAARALGADLAVNVEQEDPVKAVRRHTGGSGCDVYIEAAGSPGAVR